LKISEAFPSKYLRAADVDEMGGELHYTIRKITMEEVGKDKEQKPVVHFREGRQPLVLNQTNAIRLGAIFGEESC
jgi:hypothetical protein